MNLDELKAIRDKAKKDIQLRQKEARIKIVVGMGTSGIASGAREVLRSFVDEIAGRNLVGRHGDADRRERVSLRRSR